MPTTMLRFLKNIFLILTRRHLNQGNRYLAEREFGKAILEYTEEINKHPRNMLAWYNRGWSHFSGNVWVYREQQSLRFDSAFWRWVSVWA